MQPTPEATREALLKLLALAAGPGLSDDKGTEIVSDHIERCIERTKAEASEGAALVDACAPHGERCSHRPERLEQLEAIKTLEKLARSTLERFGQSMPPKTTPISVRPEACGTSLAATNSKAQNRSDVKQSWNFRKTRKLSVGLEQQRTSPTLSERALNNAANPT